MLSYSNSINKQKQTNKMAGIVRLKLNELNTNVSNSLIVGLMIAKGKWRKFTSITKVEKAVWSFTIRDAETQTINVTCWGSPGCMERLCNSFHVGDVLNVIKTQIRERTPGDRNEYYMPTITSPFTLIFNEETSQIQFHDGEDYCNYTKFLNIPTKPVAGLLNLYDVQTSGEGLKGQHVDLLVGVRTIGPVKTITTRVDQRKVQCRDVILMDQTHSGITTTLWEEEDILRASQWQPRETVLFIADARIDFRNNSPCIALSSKSVITLNPEVSLATSLLKHMKTSIPNTITRYLVPPPVMPSPDTTSIRNVISVEYLRRKIESLSTTPDFDIQFTGLLFAFINSFNPENFLKTKCGVCRHRIEGEIGVCFNLECPVGSGIENVRPIREFDIVTSLIDQTGEVNNVRLSGIHAETVLECSPEEFEYLSEQDKIKLKWKYLLERHEIKVMVHRFESKIQCNIISLNIVEDYADMAQKLPLF